MAALRFWVSATLAWLFAFGNVERLYAPLNIASFVYVLTAGTAIGLVLLPRHRLLSVPYVVGGVVALFLALKLGLGYPVGGASLPITVTELSAIIVTVLLSWRMVKGIEHCEQAAADTAVMQIDSQISAFEIGQEQIYREIRRARLFERPLALATIGPTRRSVRHSLSRFLQEMQNKTIEKYVYGRVGELLARRASVCDLIARRNNHFIVLLPEADRQRAQAVLQELADSIRDKLGLDVKTGMATFPDEEVTLTGLLEQAEAEMQGGGERSGKEQVLAEA